MRLLHLCECVCHRTVSGHWHFSASITIAPSVPLSLQPWRRVMSPVSLKTPTYNACPQIPTPPYPAPPVHRPLTLTLTSPSLDLAISHVPQLLSSSPPPQMTLDPTVRRLLYIQMANQHTPVWLFQSYCRFGVLWPKTANMPLVKAALWLSGKVRGRKSSFCLDLSTVGACFQLLFGNRQGGGLCVIWECNWL